VIDEMTFPTVTASRRRVAIVAQLTDIPKKKTWLQEQKSARTRRAYRLDVQHFICTLTIPTPHQLRKAEHNAPIAWGR